MLNYRSKEPVIGEGYLAVIAFNVNLGMYWYKEWVLVLPYTSKTMTKIKALRDMRILGLNNWLRKGDITYVPSSCIMSEEEYIENYSNAP